MWRKRFPGARTARSISACPRTPDSQRVYSSRILALVLSLLSFTTKSEPLCLLLDRTQKRGIALVMPQSSRKVANAAEHGLHLTGPVTALACLASDRKESTWRTYKLLEESRRKPPVAVQRPVNWYQVADTAIKRYTHVTEGHQLWWFKEKLYRWLLHKHVVLQDALEKGVILQIDVLNGVVRAACLVICGTSSCTDSGSQLEIDILELERHLVSYSSFPRLTRFRLHAGLQLIVGSALQAGLPRSEGDGAVEYRNEKQQEDQTFLEKRRGEISKAFEDWQVNQSSHRRPDTTTVEGIALKTIYELVDGRLRDKGTSGCCRSWQDDMAEMIHRMRKNWTDIERKSLISFLACFKKALNALLPPLVPSEYHPAARQPAEDREKVLELFVSGAGFAPFLGLN